MNKVIEDVCPEEGTGSNSLMQELYSLLNRDPKFLNFFLNHILDGLWYCDLTAPQSSWTSPRFWNLLGYKANDLPPPEERSWEAHIDPEDKEKCQKRFNQFLTSNKPVFELVLRFRHASGKTLWLHCRALMIRDASGTPIRIVGMYYDVTPYKLLEKSLNDSNTSLNRRQLTIAHDLKQPLATAIMLLETLKDTGDEFPESNAELVRDALNSLNGMNDQLTGILNQPEDDIDLNMQYVHVDKLIERITRDLRAKIDRHGADIRLHSPPVVQGNPILLRILFQNLIANAIKYRREDTHAVIDIRARDCQQHWEFTIADNGIGIDQQYHQTIFRRYARTEEARNREGTGLGLALCREAVASHRGRIWVKSQPGKGSTFYFTLPKQPVSLAEARNDRQY